MNYETQVDCHGILARDHSKKKKLADITRWETFLEFPIEFIMYPKPKYGGFYKYGGTPKSSSISNDGIFPHKNHPAMVVATPMTSWNPPKDQGDHVLRPAVTLPTVTVSVPPVPWRSWDPTRQCWRSHSRPYPGSLDVWKNRPCLPKDLRKMLISWVLVGKSVISWVFNGTNGDFIGF